MNTIIEKIRAEVLRIIRESDCSQWGLGMMSACNRILKFLDTLQEQPVCDGEEEEYEQIKQKVCSDCPSHKDGYCGYVKRQLQRKCNYLSDVMYGYELGRQSKPKVCEGLEEEIQNQIYNHFFDLHGIAIAGTTAYATVEDMVYIARHFYSLGRQSKEQPVCEELGREMDRFFTSEEYEEAEKAGFGETHLARHFAQWGAEHLKK